MEGLRAGVGWGDCLMGESGGDSRGDLVQISKKELDGDGGISLSVCWSWDLSL